MNEQVCDICWERGCRSVCGEDFKIAKAHIAELEAMIEVKYVLSCQEQMMWAKVRAEKLEKIVELAKNIFKILEDVGDGHEEFVRSSVKKALAQIEELEKKPEVSDAG